MGEGVCRKEMSRKEEEERGTMELLKGITPTPRS